MAKKINKYKITQNLAEVMISKVDKDKKKYGNSLIPLTEDELQKKIKEFQDQGFSVNTYHQEQFDDGYRFIKDGEGLEDIKSMTYADLERLLNQCQREVKAICKKEILNGNIGQIRQGNYPFHMRKRIYNILFKYARCHKKSIRYLIPFDCLLYLVSCIGNIYQLIDIIGKLRIENIYIYFLSSENMTDDPYDICSELKYPSIILNDYYLEDLLLTMRYKNELSDEQYKNYSWCPYQLEDDTFMDTKEFDNVWIFGVYNP